MKIFDIFFDMGEGLFRGVFNGIENILDSFLKKDGVYNAEFASKGTVFSFFSDYGFCLTGTSNLSVKDSYQNALVIGGTGVGKSSVVLIPSLYSMCGSFIVHDPSGELLAKSAG